MKGESWCARDPDDQSAQHPSKQFPECVATLADLHQPINAWVCRAQHFNAQNYSARVVAQETAFRQTSGNAHLETYSKFSKK
jgi:hypothetical protein